MGAVVPGVTHSYGNVSVEVSSGGAIFVQRGDSISKYCAAIHRVPPRSTRRYHREFARMTGGSKLVLVQNPDLIRPGESIYHVPTFTNLKKRRGVVRVIYLASADRKENADYKKAIWDAIIDVRGWYRKQLGGGTFRPGNGVEVLQSKQKAAWFTTNKTGAKQDDWHFNNALAEVNKLVGARQHDPAHVWVIYSDAPGNKGRGGAGVCMMPEDDLLGLVGKHPTQPSKKRWIGGLAHELGHALGLDHPANASRHPNAIMQGGFYGHYPNGAYLTAKGKVILANNPFIGSR